MSIRDEIERIEQSNDIAYKVIEVAQNKAPGEFVTLDFRYGIADALWDAGYRKVEQADREPSDDEVEAGARALWEARRSPTNHTWDAIAEGGLNRPYPTYPHIVDDIRREARAALLAAQEVRNRG